MPNAIKRDTVHLLPGALKLFCNQTTGQALACPHLPRDYHCPNIHIAIVT
jgi:hypothetical protein